MAPRVDHRQGEREGDDPREETSIKHLTRTHRTHINIIILHCSSLACDGASWDVTSVRLISGAGGGSPHRCFSLWFCGHVGMVSTGRGRSHYGRTSFSSVSNLPLTSFSSLLSLSRCCSFSSSCSLHSHFIVFTFSAALRYLRSLAFINVHTLTLLPYLTVSSSFITLTFHPPLFRIWTLTPATVSDMKLHLIRTRVRSPGGLKQLVFIPEEVVKR